MPPRISVIVPAYNCGPYIKTAVSSVLGQTFADLEVIVVDDGSTDSTVQELSSFSDPRLIVLRHSTNQGVSRATNTGLKRARGEYLAVLAADDEWLPAKLERQLVDLESSRNVDASYTWIQHMDVHGNRLPTIERNDLGADPVFTLVTSRQIKLACTLLIRRSAVTRTAPIDPRLRTNEDWEYLLRLALAGVRFAGVREPLTLVRLRSGSLSHSSMSAGDMRVALANVRRLRRAYPGRITGAMMARCWLRSFVWVAGSQRRGLMGPSRVPLARPPGNSGATKATSVVEKARRVVVRTNQWPGLKSLYGQAYHLGLTFTVNRLSSVPGVLAVMLRCNDDGPGWVPGLSDYDITVLTGRQDGPGSIQFLDQLWARYRSIKRTVPQLGELQVMDVEEYRDFLDFGPMPTSSLKHAQPLFVKAGNSEIDRVLQHEARRPEQREFLLDALSRYARFAFPAWLDTADGDSVRRHRTEHLLGNVSKRLARLGIRVDTARNGTLADRMVLTFEALSRACGMVNPGGGTGTLISPHPSSITDGAFQSIKDFCETAVHQSGVRECSAVTWMPYMSVNPLNLALIVPDDIPHDELRRLLITLRTLHRTTLPLPILASDAMWSCWRELSPFDGVAVAASGQTVIGATRHPHPGPSPASLRRGAEVEYASLLPLKNNWRLSEGQPSGGSYATLVKHVKGCASALTERVLTSPPELEYTSIDEGYPAAVEALRALRTSLSS
jgi:glycosyltransferase involved in cell wall biosynthesis